MSLPVLVINRDQDTDRLAAFSASTRARGIDFSRIAALDGHRAGFPFALHADLIGPQFWGKPDAKPGAIGCFLSHRRAWQHVVDTGLDRALICEDDAVFTTDLSGVTAVVDGLGPFDLLFANGRMAAWGAATGAEASSPLPTVLDGLAQRGGPAALGLKPSPGADCYLITRRGAERLLAVTAAQRIGCGVDWAMLWNGLGEVSAPLASAFPELGILADTMDPSDAPLSVHVLSSPAADQAVETPSVIRHKITRPIGELTARRSSLAHAEYVSTLCLGDAVLSFAGRSGPDPVMAAHREGVLWDEPGLALLLSRFPEGGSFVDIGAHLGNHAVAMSVLGGAGRVLAVEPNDEITRLLRANIAMNGLSGRVTLAAPGQALWHRAGEGWLVRNRKRSSESMVKAEPPDDRTGVVPVRLVPGDDLLAETTVDAIKIDTSGSEPEVLRGLTGTLQVHRPLVLIDHGVAAQDRIARLAGARAYDVARTVPSSRQNRLSSLLVPRPDGGG